MVLAPCMTLLPETPSPCITLTMPLCCTLVIQGSSDQGTRVLAGLNWELDTLNRSNSMKYHFINDHCDGLYKMIMDHHWTGLILWNNLSVMIIVISYIKWLWTIIKKLLTNKVSQVTPKLELVWHQSNLGLVWSKLGCV